MTHAGHPRLRISQEVEPWILARSRASERKALRKDYEHRVQAGSWPTQETTVPERPPPPDGLAESTSPFGPIFAVIRTEPFMFGSSWRPLL